MKRSANNRFERDAPTAGFAACFRAPQAQRYAFQPHWPQATTSMRLFAIVFLAMLLSSCAKTPDPAVCTSLDRTIDHNIKKIALTLVEGEISDKGAMQQAARYTMVSSRLQVIATNLELQSKNNCQVRQTPIDPLVYEEAAMKCFSATLRQEPEAASLCEFKNWSGNAK